MTPEQFEKEVEASIKKTQETVPVLGDLTSKDEPSIEGHIERVRAFALANACITDEDLIRVYSEGLNRAVFAYSKQWLVSISLVVAYEVDDNRFYWQVSTSLINAFTGKAKPIGILSNNERKQLTDSRDIVIRDVSDVAGSDESSITRFHDRTTYSACCDLSAAEEDLIDELALSSRETPAATPEAEAPGDRTISVPRETSPDTVPDRIDSAASAPAA